MAFKITWTVHTSEQQQNICGKIKISAVATGYFCCWHLYLLWNTLARFCATAISSSCIIKWKIYDNNIETFRNWSVMSVIHTVHMKYIFILVLDYFHLELHFDTFLLRIQTGPSSSTYFKCNILFFTFYMKGYDNDTLVRIVVVYKSLKKRVSIKRHEEEYWLFWALSSASRANNFSLFFFFYGLFT